MPDEVDLLGDPQTLLGADRAALLPAAATAGAQVRATIGALSRVMRELSGLKPRALLVIADGRAAHDAAVFVALLGPECAVPVVIRSDLPVWVGALDVVVILESGTPGEAAAAAVAHRRGATVLVRGAPRGELAEALPGQLFVPPIGVPEVLAGPGRLAFLLGVADGLRLLRPALDERTVESVAELLDTESLACAPRMDAFVNPAISLAQQFTEVDLVLTGLDPVGRNLAGHAAATLAELARSSASAFGATELIQATGLMLRLGQRRDIFADPYGDSFGDQRDRSPVLPIILRVTRPADEGLAKRQSAWFRSIQRALPTAIVIDGPELSLAPVDSGMADQQPRTEPTGWAREWASVALMMLRLDFAAVYLGIAEGQAAPLDSPAGLGPHDGARHLLQPDTVVSSYRDEEDFDRWN